jgi:hypothetical protein
MLSPYSDTFRFWLAYGMHYLGKSWFGMRDGAGEFFVGRRLEEANLTFTNRNRLKPASTNTYNTKAGSQACLCSEGHGGERGKTKLVSSMKCVRAYRGGIILRYYTWEQFLRDAENNFLLNQRFSQQ